MKAQIKPLGSKYYGTVIETPWGEINLWLRKGHDDKPSIRELMDLNLSLAEWQADPEKWELIDSGHYETHISFETAKTICNAINESD